MKGLLGDANNAAIGPGFAPVWVGDLGVCFGHGDDRVAGLDLDILELTEPP